MLKPQDSDSAPMIFSDQPLSNPAGLSLRMKYLYSFAFIGITGAFQVIPSRNLLSRRRGPMTMMVAAASSSSALYASDEDQQTITYFEDLERAVECATKFGLCDVDTLLALADKVEAGADSCLFEVEEALCEKEINDRKEVAEVLRLQSELQLRMDAIEKSSLFAADVKDEHDIRDREEFIELLSEDGGI
jgi:hypothetical protein